MVSRLLPEDTYARLLHEICGLPSKVGSSDESVSVVERTLTQPYIACQQKNQIILRISDSLPYSSKFLTLTAVGVGFVSQDEAC